MAVVLAGLAIADAVRDEIRDHGIADVRFSQLFVFAQLAQGPQTVTAIATRMGFSHQAASQMVGELEKAGLTRRVPNPDDLRSRLVELTSEGWEALRIGVVKRDQLLGQLAEANSARSVETARRVVMDLLDLAGGLDSVRIRDLSFPKST